jgi:lipopolysaccharide transport protein LptA
LEESNPAAEAESDKKNNTGTTDKKNQGKQISRIICEGNVVIIRKPAVSAEGKEESEQKATAGHADYDVKTGMIVLTKDPVMTRGEDSVKGEVITIWRDSEKVVVGPGSKLELKSETIKESQSTKSNESQENK